MAEIISCEDAQYALDLVTSICNEVGPGLPGTPQERERAGLIARELESHLGANNVVLEEFTVAPGAFLGWMPICALLALVAALLNVSLGHLSGVSLWLTSVSALVLSIVSVLPVVFEFILYREFTDLFFRKKRSINVIGTLRKPGTNAVKRVLILSGHHDSALENTWLRLLGYGFFAVTLTLVLAPIMLLVMSAIQVVGLISGSDNILRLGTMGPVMLAYPIVPYVVFGMFFNLGRGNGGSVPGAADNLSGSALAVAMCRFLVKNPSCIPEGTEIRFISFGSEEAGIRGSRHYVARHHDELKRFDSRLLNYETIAHPDITILRSDVNGTVKHSPEMVASAAAAAERAGVPYMVKPGLVGTGGTDAASFSQAGLKATTLMPFQLPQQMVAFYHQRWDRPDVLTIEPLLNVMKLTYEWVCSGGE